jgi:hypothetical protein
MSVQPSNQCDHRRFVGGPTPFPNQPTPSLRYQQSDEHPTILEAGMYRVVMAFPRFRSQSPRNVVRVRKCLGIQALSDYSIST